jgi:hypothetical protein
MPFHIIGILVMISGMCDVIALLLVSQKLSTALVGNIFFIAQFCLLSYYYYAAFLKDEYVIFIGVSLTQFSWHL